MSSRPLKVFVSYSHEDDLWRKKLDAHLSLLKRQGILAVWHDRCLVGGEDWEKTINEELRSADIVLLLVSADFIHSDYCFGLEMSTALERDSAGQARVVPIIVRACDWTSAAFSRCQAFPRDNKPVASHPDGEDAALTEVARELRKLAEEMRTADSAVVGEGGEGGEGSKPTPIYQPQPWWQRHRRLLLAGGVAVLALLLIAAGSGWVKSGDATRAGNRDLRIGAYAAAAERFAVARRWNPLSGDARWGERLAALGLMLPDMQQRGAEFSRELESLAAERPEDAMVKFLAGDRAFEEFRRGAGADRLDAAEQAYREAAAADSTLPEAFARLGFIYDLKGDLPAAEQAWRQALDLAHKDEALLARYRNDLADVLAQRGQRQQALQLYDGNTGYAQSAVAGAMLRWQEAGEGDALQRARDQLESVRQQLADAGPAQAWGFKADGQLVLLGRRESQRCLAELALAASEHLLRRPEAAQAALDRTINADDCTQLRADLTLVVCDRLAKAAADSTRDWLQCPTLVPHSDETPAEPAAVPLAHPRTRT